MLYLRYEALIRQYLAVFSGTAAGTSAGASNPVVFINGVHYGMYFTLILAIFDFVIA